MRMLPPFPWTGHGGGIKKGDGALLQRRPETLAAFAGPHGTGINVWMRPYLMSSMKAT